MQTSEVSKYGSPARLGEIKTEGTSSLTTPELSIVILCYKAEDFVPIYVGKVKQLLETEQLRYELVLVANFYPQEGRPDSTPAITAELARKDTHVRTVAKPKQGGMGWDLRSGLVAATGDAVAFIDGDGQMPPEDVIVAYKKFQEGSYDLVTTYRIDRFDGVIRTVISWIFNRLFKLLFPWIKVRDVNSKPKILSRRALDMLNLRSDGWFIDAEIIILASRLGLRIGEVPTKFYRNEYRKSFIRPSAFLEFIQEMLRHRFVKAGRNGHR